MAETQEATADITAKMRNYSNDCNDGYHTDYGVVLEDMRNFADHFDAAHKREVDVLKQRCAELNAEVAAKDEVIKRLNDAISEEQRRKMSTTENQSAVGDMAKLREALGKLRAELWNNTVIAGKRKFELYEIADAALAAPPRNCDVGTPHEQADRAFAFCLGRSCKTCEFAKLTFRECTLKWAQLPCGKGGAK